MGGLSHTVSGDIASFRTPSRVPIESLKFHFLPKQAAGTPSPDNPIPIEGWTGLNGHRCRKNLYSSIGLIYGKWILGTGEVQEAMRGALTKEIPVSTGEVYSFSFNGSSYLPYSIEVVEYDKDKNYLRRNYSTKSGSYETPPTNITFTVGSNTKYIVCGVFSTEDSAISQEKIESYKMQLERGPVSSYEPYSGEQIPITFPSNGKNIVDWPTPDGFSANVDFFNGWNTNWISGPFRVDKSYVGKILTYSADINNTAASRTSYLHVWTRDKNNNYVRIDIQSEVVDAGESKRVSVSMVVDVTWYDIYFGLSIGRGSIVSHPMVEWGDAATSYEPYTANNTFYGGYIDPVAGEIVAEYQELILGEDISPKINNRASSYNYVSSASGADGSAVIYFEMGWTSAQPQYGKYTCNYSKRSAAIMNKMKYNSYDATVIRYLAAEMNEGEFGFTKSTTTFDSDGDGMVYCVLTVPSTCTDLAEAREWLEQNPIKFYYPLKHPLHIPITTQDLKAFLDHNNFWSDANDITEVTYAVTESKDILATRKKAMDFDHAHHKKVKWNQLARPVESGQWTPYDIGNASIGFSNGVGTRTTLRDVTQPYSDAIRSVGSVSFSSSHKYYIRQDLLSSVTKYYISVIGSEWRGQHQVNANVWTTIKSVGYPASSDNTEKPLWTCYSASAGNISKEGETCQFRNFMFIDLTLMFGAGNEPQTVAEFEHICEINGIDLTTYQPYDTGSDRWLIIP